MGPNLLMAAGALTWLTGELWGAFRRKAGMDTTSEWVWWAEMKWPVVRILVAGFTLSLFAHLEWGTMLLP